MKKYAAFLLACLMLASCITFSACGEAENEDIVTDAPTVSGTASETETTDIYADLPVEKLGGEFNILQYKEIASATCTVIPEEGDAAPIAEKLIERARVVEERLDVTFANTLCSRDDTTARFRQNVLGGMDDYDVCWHFSPDAVAGFLNAGLLLPLNDVNYFDFSKPWWDNYANEWLRVGKNLYFAFGDVNVYLYDFHSAIVFDKELMADMHKDMYSLVENGTWTMDEFITVVTNASLEENGKWVRKGFEIYTYFGTTGLLHGADVEILLRDEDTYVPYVDGVSEEFAEVMSRYSELLCRPYCDGRAEKQLEHFAARKVALMGVGVGELGTLRGESFDYGILPYPKRTVDQKAYISYVTSQIQGIVLPITAHDPDRTGLVLENLCAESYRMVRPHYFEVMLKYKYLRDEKSIAMLNLLFDSETRIDIEKFYNWAGMSDLVCNAMVSKDGSRITSIIKKKENAINKAIAATVKIAGGE